MGGQGARTFDGAFDGKGHEIVNVKIDAQDSKTAITAEQFQTENQTIEQQYPADSSIKWIPLIS